MRGPYGELSVRRLPLGHPDLESAWLKIQAADGVPSVFLTCQWSMGVLREPSTEAATSVCVVERHGVVIGLFPVERATVAGLRTLGPAGWRWLAPDHLDVVSFPEDRAEVARAIVDDILSWGGVDVFDMDGLADRGALTVALVRSRWHLIRRRIIHVSHEQTITPYVSLSQQPVLRSASLRSQVGRGLRVIERAGGGFEMVTEPEHVVRLLDRLMTLHVQRFGQTSAVFATEARRRAHRIAAAQLASDGLARIYHLHTPEGDVALLYALRIGTTLSYYSAGMRTDAFLSPGRTLLGLVAIAAADEGLNEFDLLRGNHEYKSRFASNTKNDVRIRLLRATSRMGCAAARRLPALVESRRSVT